MLEKKSQIAIWVFVLLFVLYVWFQANKTIAEYKTISEKHFTEIEKVNWELNKIKSSTWFIFSQKLEQSGTELMKMREANKKSYETLKNKEADFLKLQEEVAKKLGLTE